MKIVAFGDSTTASRMVEGKPLTVYADLLRAELPGLGVDATVINSGIPGDNTNQGLARFERDVLDHKPDLAVIQFGINDATIEVWRDPPGKESPVPLVEFAANLATMVRRLKAQRARVILMTHNPMRWTPALRDYYAKPPYNPDDPMGLNAPVAPYAATVRRLAVGESVGLVDVYELFLNHGHRDGQSIDGLLLDGMHPNAMGHRMVADALERVLAPERKS